MFSAFIKEVDGKTNTDTIWGKKASFGSCLSEFSNGRGKWTTCHKILNSGQPFLHIVPLSFKNLRVKFKWFTVVTHLKCWLPGTTTGASRARQLWSESESRLLVTVKICYVKYMYIVQIGKVQTHRNMIIVSGYLKLSVSCFPLQFFHISFVTTRHQQQAQGKLHPESDNTWWSLQGLHNRGIKCRDGTLVYAE